MNRVYATLSADIVDSTSFSAEDTVKLKESLEGFFPVMQLFCDKAWGRVTRGDSVECVIPDEFKEKVKHLAETTMASDEEIVVVCEKMGIEVKKEVR